jgi:hypothetical protein
MANTRDDDEAEAFLSDLTDVGRTPALPAWPGPSEDQPVSPITGDALKRYTGGQVTAGGLALECNQAARMKEGQLLVVFTERCYLIDPATGSIELFFQLHRDPKSYWWMAVPAADGSVYCSVSGSTSKTEPIQVAEFDNFGTVVRVDPIKGSMEVILDEPVVDPFGLELVGDHLMVVSDFNGWGGTGSILIVDVRTGAWERLARGGELVDPQMATLDEEGVLWIANSMHRQYDGSIVRVDPGNVQTVVYPRHGPGSGIVSGIFPSRTPDKLLFVVIDWPYMARSAVYELNKADNSVELLLGASTDDPKLYNAHGGVQGDVLYIGESYNNLIIEYDLVQRKVVREIDISGILGRSKGHGVRGVFDSFDFLECINIVPPQSSSSVVFDNAKALPSLSMGSAASKQSRPRG